LGFAQTAGGFQPMVVYCTKRRNDRLSNPSWPGLLVPAITTRTELAKDAIPVSDNPKGMAGLSTVMTRLAAHAVRQKLRRLVLEAGGFSWIFFSARSAYLGDLCVK
jgi:hypothetical protein